MGSIPPSGRPPSGPSGPKAGSSQAPSSSSPSENPSSASESTSASSDASSGLKTGDSYTQGANKTSPSAKATASQAATAGRMPKLAFNSQEMAFLAATFAKLLVQNPGLSRRERAKMFALAILKRQRRKKGHFLASLSPEELEDMCDEIAAQLEEAPGMAQTIEDVTVAAENAAENLSR